MEEELRDLIEERGMRQRAYSAPLEATDSVEDVHHVKWKGRKGERPKFTRSGEIDFVFGIGDWGSCVNNEDDAVPGEFHSCKSLLLRGELERVSEEDDSLVSADGRDCLQEMLIHCFQVIQREKIWRWRSNNSEIERKGYCFPTRRLCARRQENAGK